MFHYRFVYKSHNQKSDILKWCYWWTPYSSQAALGGRVPGPHFKNHWPRKMRYLKKVINKTVGCRLMFAPACSPTQRHKARVLGGYLGDDVAQPLRLDEVELLQLKCRIVKVQ